MACHASNRSSCTRVRFKRAPSACPGRPDFDRDHDRRTSTRAWRAPEAHASPVAPGQAPGCPLDRQLHCAHPASRRSSRHLPQRLPRYAVVRGTGQAWPPASRSSRTAPTHHGCREGHRHQERAGPRGPAEAAHAIARHPEHSIWPVPATSKPKPNRTGGSGAPAHRLPATVRSVTQLANDRHRGPHMVMRVRLRWQRPETA